jgi:hypothetical protein
MATTDGPYRIPQLGEYVGGSPKDLKFASVILAATSSDSDENIVSDTQETVSVFQVQAGTFVRSVGAYVATAFTASVTLALGDSDDTEGWMSAARIGATSTGILAIVDSDALDSDDIAVYESAGGKYYPAEQSIDVVIGGADPAVGRLVVWIIYADASSKDNLSTST